MIEKKLKTGKKVLIRDLELDVITNLKDIMHHVAMDGGRFGMVNVHRHKIEWIRTGLGGLGDWKAMNGEIVADELIKSLTNNEQDELLVLIQEAQVLNPSKPSRSA